MNLILPCAPGCCEEGCSIAADSFDRSDNTNINTGAPFTWSGTGASIEIFSNTLVMYSGVEERLRADVPHPDSTESGVVSAVINLAVATEYGDIWLNGDDVDNCLVARLTCGSPGALKIISRSAGAETELESASVTVSASTNYTVTLYYNVTELRATATVGATTICAFDVPAVGYYSGIGSESSFVVFDDFEYQKLGDGETECPEEPACTSLATCGASSYPCCATEYPDFFDITIPAGLYTADTCACLGVNGLTFTLERNGVEDRDGTLGGTSRWSYFQEAYCVDPGVVYLGSTVKEVDLVIVVEFTCVSGPSCQMGAIITLSGYTATGILIPGAGQIVRWSVGGSGLSLQDSCNTRTWVLGHTSTTSGPSFCTIDATPGDVSIVKH